MAVTYFNPLKYIQGDLAKVVNEGKLCRHPKNLTALDLIDQ